MLRSALILIFTMALIFSCGEKKKSAMLKGEIATLDGKAPQTAHVHIFEMGANPFKPLQTVAADEYGSFEIEMPQKEKLEVMITAAGHPFLRFPVMNRTRKDVQVTIVLRNYNYVRDFSGVKIVGDWNKFIWGSAVKMKMQKDSTFIYERKTDSDTLGYQLLNITKNRRSVNGTMWDYLRYDGGGDYISVINVKDGKARVVFDPKKLPVPVNKNRAEIIITQGDITMQPFMDIALHMERTMHKRNVVAESYYNEFKSLAGFLYRSPGLMVYLNEKMMQKQDSLLAKYAALQIAGFWSINGRVKDLDLIEVTGKLPITDDMWQAEPMLATRIFSLALGKSRADSVFEKNLERISNSNVKAAVLIHLGLKAKSENNMTRMAEIHEEISALQADLPGLDFFIGQIDPSKKILNGKPIPDFSYKLFDSKDAVSKESLKGKYYMIDFWATWCGPCVREMPTLHKVYKKYKKSNFTILSLSYDRSKNDVRRFTNGKWKMPWQHVFLSAEERDEAAIVFEVQGIPKPILVGADGKILASESELRGDNLDRTLEKYLK